MEQNLVEFSEWYSKKLHVCGYPVIPELISNGDKKGKYQDFEVIVNVSDEFWFNYAKDVVESGKMYGWFPMGEEAEDIGLSSMFGALNMIYQAYQLNKSVLLHCHAGVNRSQTIKTCLCFMVTGNYALSDQSRPIASRRNMLFFNCEYNHLPSIEVMENWLKHLKIAFDNPEKFLGGMYDWSLLKAGITKNKQP